MSAATNIHERARQMVAQSPRPMELSEAYSALSKRRKRRDYGRTKVDPRTTRDLAAIEPGPLPQAMWAPYRDD